MCTIDDVVKRYLRPGDEGAFLGWTLQPKPVWSEQQCLKCWGYGGWNVQLNQYPSSEHELLKHHRKHCSNCNGRGWTVREDHVHDWRFHEQQTPSLHTEKCSICRRVQQLSTTD